MPRPYWLSVLPPDIQLYLREDIWLTSELQEPRYISANPTTYLLTQLILDIRKLTDVIAQRS